MSDNPWISAVTHRNSSLWTSEHQQTDFLRIAGDKDTSVTWSHTQQGSSWVERTSWLLLVPFWQDANYIFLRTSHFFSLSSSSPIPQMQITAAQRPQPGESRSELIRSVGASSNLSLAGTQQQRRHQLVRCNAANAATETMTQDAHSTIPSKTGSSKNTKQHAIECEYNHIAGNGHQLMVWHTAGIWQEVRDQFIAACIGNSLRLTKASDLTVYEINHHDVVSAGMFRDKCHDEHPRDWTKQSFITLEEATDACMGDVIAESHG